MSESQLANRDQSLEKFFFRASAVDFKKISGSPLAYWLSPSMLGAFENYPSLGKKALLKEGLNTTNNEKFLRRWFEVPRNRFLLNASNGLEALSSEMKWFPCQKGGGYRKWYGNNDYVVNWLNDGQDIKKIVVERYGSVTKRVVNEHLYFKSGITWSAVSASRFAMRYVPHGSIFETAGSMCFFPSQSELLNGLALCNSCVTSPFLGCVSPTLSFKPGPVGLLPIAPNISQRNADIAETALEIAKVDWDSSENSWGFTSPLLLHSDQRQAMLKSSYQKLHASWRDMTTEMQRLEEENNRIFIDAYGLQDELTPEVPLNEITLTCNPHYRYGGDKTEEELEALLLADTMREFISYAVGCMFGRYALDKPGLVLANQGETIEDYRRLVPNSRFEADADNVIPMLDGEWFADDVTERFRQFLRVTFGDDHYDENLAFIEQALNPKGKRNYTLRDYMLGEFYADHVKRYKKRPIYWLFSSPKGTFNALIYLHRYRPDTASVVLRYLREFRAKLAARQSTLEQVLINPATSQGEKTKAVKEIDSLKKQIIELQDYENDTLYPLATAQVAIDLDDGVKVNYLKLGAALKKITGLDAKEED